MLPPTPVCESKIESRQSVIYFLPVSADRKRLIKKNNNRNDLKQWIELVPLPASKATPAVESVGEEKQEQI